MGIFTKAAIVGAGYYAYKHYSDKKKAQQNGEMAGPSNQQHRHISPPNYSDNYRGDNKSQYQYSDNGCGANGYPREKHEYRESRRELDYPQQNASQATFATQQNEYASGAKY